jgi:ribosomal protein S18 acetylase RimI-like enzyme
VIRIERATRADAAQVLALQKLAYLSEAAIYDDPHIPPLTQTLEETLVEFEDWVVLKALEGDSLVGSVRGRLAGETCHIGKLIVHPDFQNRGIGSRLMAEIEAAFDQAQRFELFTGHLSQKALYLYQKLGYRPFRQQPVTDRLSLIFLEKSGPAGG